MTGPAIMDRETQAVLTADIVAAFVSNNQVPVAELPVLIASIGGALAGLGQAEPEEVKPVPAVSVRASVKADHLVCLDCGSRAKMLKRHIMTAHGLTPDEYRKRFNLPADYPMTAPDYSQRRRELAVQCGLGRDPHQRRGRRKAAA